MLHCNSGQYDAIKHYVMLYWQIARLPLKGGRVRGIVWWDGP
jgi:hypothetical protein